MAEETSIKGINSNYNNKYEICMVILNIKNTR